MAGTRSDQKEAPSRDRGNEIEVTERERLAAVGRVAATIAHDLGTPLNSVLGYTQLLMQGELNDSRREKLTIIESQVRRMIETIQRILDRTRGHEIPREPVDVREVAADVGATMAAAAEEKGVALEISIAADTPRIRADAIAIRQILINLVINAIEASPEGGSVRLTGRPEMVRGHAGGVVLEVSDNGPGVPEDQRSQVFEPLFTTRQAMGGTGLGLAIVHWLTREHGGVVSVDGGPTGGAVFRVRLPLD